MPPRKRPSSVLNGEADDLPREADRVTSPDDALAAAEEADAEAAEAEAVAAAARARARAIRLRREAAAAAAAAEAKTKAKEVESTAVEESATPELDQPSSAAEVTETAKPVSLTKTAVEDEPESGLLDDEDLNDEDLDDEDEVDEAGEQSSPAAWKVIAKALVAAVAVVGSIALLGLSGAMYWHGRNVEAQRTQSAEFAAAARQGVVTLMSLDFNKAKEDVDRIIDNTTGDFKKDFQGQANSFISVAQNSKVVTEATVNAVAVQSMTNDQATVLVAVTTNVSNKASNKQDPRSWRLRVGMARDGDRIKLSKVEFVP
jgi:Mce-associated membrane protein